MTIVLPGYEVVFDGKVYSRDFIINPGDGDIDLREILILARYTAPTEDQVVEYLKELADKVSTRASLLVGVSSDLPDDASDLEKLVMKLPTKVISDIRTGNKNCIDFIRDNTPALNEEVPSSYLCVRSGLLLQNIVTENQNKITGPEWYEKVLKNKQLKSVGLGQKYKISIKLFDEKLPDRNEFYVLLKHEVSDSKTLKVDGSFDSEDVQRVCSALYEGLQTRESIVGLDNVSEVALKEAASIPVERLYKNFELSKALDSMQRNGRRDPNSGLRH